MRTKMIIVQSIGCPPSLEDLPVNPANLRRGWEVKFAPNFPCRDLLIFVQKFKGILKEKIRS